jgi:hypothetical protein
MSRPYIVIKFVMPLQPKMFCFNSIPFSRRQPGCLVWCHSHQAYQNCCGWQSWNRWCCRVCYTFVAIYYAHCLLSMQESTVDEAADTRSESVNNRPSSKCMYIYSICLSWILSLNSYLVVVLQRKHHTKQVAKRPGKWCFFQSFR